MENKLGFKGCKDFHNCLVSTQKILANPRSFLKIADNFFNSCEISEPTKAHIAIAKFPQKIVLTENVDSLHQKTAIEVINKSNLKKNKKLKKV